jgi:hypothetical protein
MSDKHSSATSAEMHMKHLIELQKSFIPPKLNSKQKRSKEDRKLGRKLWEERLASYRDEKAKLKELSDDDEEWIDDNDDSSYNDVNSSDEEELSDGNEERV